MLLASTPFREWSLLSSQPTSRAHNRSLCQGDPTGREAGLDVHLSWRCMSRSVPHFHAQFTQYINVFTVCFQYVDWPFKASRRWYAGRCPSSTYKMSKPYDWINAAHVVPEHTTWNVRWQSSGSPEAGRQSKAATAQCQAFACEDIQRNRRRTRTCIICLPSSGSMPDASEGYPAWYKVLAWPRKSHYQPGTSNTHLMALKTWPTASHRAARARW